MNSSSEINGGSNGGWRDSYRTAQMITLPDVTRVCGLRAGQLVIDLAQGAGCPHEYILMPLISTCAALMGPQSEVRVHACWSEPPVLWIAVGARASSRKSAALRQVVAPLLSLIDDVQRHCRRPLQQRDAMRSKDGPAHAAVDWRLPLVHTGTPTIHQLRNLAVESEGRVLHVTERLEDSHHRLNIHPQNPEMPARAQMQDLYEGFPGQFTVHVDSAREHGKQGPGPLAAGILSQLLCFNQCGFADPEYIVNLTVKSPSWMSGRFLISCPSTADITPSAFSLPPVDEEDGDGGYAARGSQRSRSLTLKDVYRKLARAHARSSCRYLFSPEAMHELRRFQEEEWSTIMAQLNAGEHSGVISKSLGHVVRLAGVLKALSEAADSAWKSLGRDDLKDWCPEDEDVPEGEMEVEIGVGDVARALELGKYFLEQKMSMTFMFSPGFFRSSSGSSQNSQQDQQGYANSSNQRGSRLMSSIMVGQGRPLPGPGALGMHISIPGFHPSQHAMLGAQSGGQAGHLPPPSVLTPHQQQQLFSASTLGPVSSGLSPQGRGHLSVPQPPPALSHHAPSSASSPVAPVDIDVTQLPATWMPATPEEEMAEMSQTAEFVQLEPTQFIAMHARRVKRLMECFDDGCGVSATTAAQKSIAPPVRVAGTNNRHPAWASALFFQKVADLGLGIAEQVRHPTNGRVYWRFKRKPVTELTEKNFQLLQYLRVDMVRYSRLGQPSLGPIPGFDSPADASPVAGIGEPGVSGMMLGNAGDEVSNASSKGDSGDEMSSIKQEVL